MMANPYGVLDELIKEAAVGLGPDGLAALRKLLLSARDERLASPSGREHQAARRYDHTLSTISLALRDVADCQGDVDAYMEAHSGRDPSNPAFATEIAMRLVAADRGTEALAVLDAATPSPINRFFHEEEWTAARVVTLENLGRGRRRKRCAGERSRNSSAGNICATTSSGSRTLMTLRPRKGHSLGLSSTRAFITRLSF